MITSFKRRKAGKTRCLQARTLILLIAGLLASVTVLTSVAQVSTNQAPGDTDGVDHAGIIAAWNPETLVRGEKLYHTLCLPCHGTPQQQGTLPVSRAFWKEPFKNGNDPFSIYQTIGKGLVWCRLIEQQTSGKEGC